MCTTTKLTSVLSAGDEATATPNRCFLFSNLSVSSICKRNSCHHQLCLAVKASKNSISGIHISSNRVVQDNYKVLWTSILTPTDK